MGNFKDCKKCEQVWTTRDEFLNDDNIVLIGFMADNNVLEKEHFFSIMLFPMTGVILLLGYMFQIFLICIKERFIKI